MLMEIAKAGSTTLAMTAQSNTAPYQLKTASWPLGISGRSRSLLRDFPYDDAVEEYVIHIFGTTYAECLTNYNALIVRLNDAADFTDGLQSVPVLWRVKPEGATEIRVSVILGPVGDKPMVNAAPNILEFEDGFWIRDVPVSFMRRPLLVSTVEASSSQAAGSAIGTVQTVSFAAAATTPSPTRLYVQATPTNLGGNDIAYGFAILTESNTAGVGANLNTIAASTLAGATDYSTPVDSAANRSSSANLLRFTPTVTTRRVSGNPGLSIPYQKALILAEVRNNLLGKEYVIDVELLAGVRWVRGRSEVIDGLSTAARYVVLGVVHTPIIVSGIRIGIQAASTGGTLDLDRLFIVDAAKTQLIQHGVLQQPGDGGLYADHRYLTATAPKVNVQDAFSIDVREFWTVDANPMLLTKSQELQAVWQPFPGTSAWSLPATPSGRYAVRTQAFRYPASQIPQ